LTIALFTSWYASGRILTDFLRTDPRRLLGLTGSQLVAITALVAVALVLWWRSRGARDRPSMSIVNPSVARGDRKPGADSPAQGIGDDGYGDRFESGLSS